MTVPLQVSFQGIIDRHSASWHFQSEHCQNLLIGPYIFEHNFDELLSPATITLKHVKLFFIAALYSFTHFFLFLTCFLPNTKSRYFRVAIACPFYDVYMSEDSCL